MQCIKTKQYRTLAVFSQKRNKSLTDETKAQFTDQIKQSARIYCFWNKSNHATFVINRRKSDACNQEGAELIATYVTLIILDTQVSGHRYYFFPVLLHTHSFVFKMKKSFLAKLVLK